MQLVLSTAPSAVSHDCFSQKARSLTASSVCGDVENIVTAGASLISESNCQVVCSGNSSTICGGDSLLSYYSWDGPALYNWSFPVGPSAGEHSLLIGGVCIPLMTSQMITGKVTFVEKFGTGEPNSTGAYELDLSAIDNFTLAWRPMHVKTDVFCSAGLILPDIAGRQIDVGGVRACILLNNLRIVVHPSYTLYLCSSSRHQLSLSHIYSLPLFLTIK